MELSLANSSVMEAYRTFIVKYDDPRLIQKSKNVEDHEFGLNLEITFQSMIQIMHQERGCGLAGVQIGDMRRILVASDRGNVFCMANPQIVKRSGETKVMEGCLSFPGLQIAVPRSRFITVEYKNEQGITKTVEFKDFAAVVVQHEMDHLDGVTLRTHQKRIAEARSANCPRKKRKN